jgi:hypothetical protein
MLISKLPEPYKSLAKFFKKENTNVLERAFEWSRCTGQHYGSHNEFWHSVAAGNTPKIPISLLRYYKDTTGEEFPIAMPKPKTKKKQVEAKATLRGRLVEKLAEKAAPAESTSETVVVEIPEGYEFDQENTIPGKIVFKKKPLTLEERMPKSWMELKKIKGYYVSSQLSKIFSVDRVNINDAVDKNVFATEDQAEAALALAQLSQLREVYREGWTPDWRDHSKDKQCIIYKEGDGGLMVVEFTFTRHFLSFQSFEVAQLFLNNFRDLIMEALPLMS